jgi:hypothetical protein
MVVGCQDAGRGPVGVVEEKGKVECEFGELLKIRNR